MKEALNICLLQCDLHWEDALKNRTQIDDYLAEVKGADIILLPELFSTCLLYTSPSPRDATLSRMPSSA